jgi:general secretion pathway protein L
MFERTITGLDVGSHSVKAAELRAGLRTVEFVRFEEGLLPPGPPEEREAALFTFVRERSLSLELIVGALPSDRFTQRHLRFPFSDPRRVRQAVPFEVEGALAIGLEGLLLAHESARVSTDQTDVLAMMCPRGEVATWLNAMRHAGVEPRILEADGVVLANLSASLELSDVPRLLIDLGHSKTNVCLLVDGRPALLRSIPLAGRHLDAALAADLQLEPEAAVHYKCDRGAFDAGGAPLGPQTAALLQRLAQEILRSVQAVVSDSLQPLAPAEAVLVGGTALLHGLPGWLSTGIGLPCRRLQVPESAPEVAALARAGPERFAQAAALALRGASTRRVTTVDFRQGEFAYTPDLTDLRRGLQVSVGLLAAVLLLWIGSLAAEVASENRRATRLREAIANVYAQTFPDAPPESDAFRALEQRVQSTRELAEHLGVTGTGLSGLDVLREISGRIPNELDVSLTELNVERRSVQARGYARDFESVDRIRKELSGVEWFEEVRLTDVVTDPRRGGKNFNLTIRLREASS